jgi:hypothetical protein
MTEAEPQPDAAASDQAAAWPVALAMVGILYGLHVQAYLLAVFLPHAESFLKVFTPQPWMSFQGYAEFFLGSGATPTLLAPLLAVPLIFCCLAILIRRRWALLAAGVWAIVSMTVWLSFAGYVSLNSQMLRPYCTRSIYLTIEVPYHLIVPGLVLCLLLGPSRRRQFQQWAARAAPKVQPVWPTVLGWLSMFHAAEGLMRLAEALSSKVLFALDSEAWWNAFLKDVGESSYLLAYLAMVLLGIPAVALLRRRRGAGWLHVAGACAVLAGLLMNIIKWTFYWDGPLPSTGIICEAISAVYPVFLLVWFLRPAIRRQVAQWRRPAAAGIIPPAGERGS